MTKPMWPQLNILPQGILMNLWNKDFVRNTYIVSIYGIERKIMHIFLIYEQNSERKCYYYMILYVLSMDNKLFKKLI